MKLIGITGGIGMGKSTAGKILQEKGFPVADTDAIAHELVQPNQPALAEIVAQFGAHLLDADGRLRRDELAKIAFSDDQARHRLEAILHPRIRERWLVQTQNWRASSHPFGFVLIPLLFETNAAAEFDATICVACSKDSQHTRLLARGWTTEHLTRRIAAQWSVERKMDASTFLVWTDTTLPVHTAQLTHILQVLSVGCK